MKELVRRDEVPDPEVRDKHDVPGDDGLVGHFVEELAGVADPELGVESHQGVADEGIGVESEAEDAGVDGGGRVGK